MKPIELLERYVNEVGHHLPRKNRSDIQLELLSLLQDELEERTPSGKESSLQTAAELLREFGKPEKMAAQYRPEQYLIGPNLFPIYKLVATIVTSVIGGFHGILLLLAFFNGSLAENPLGGLLNIISSFANIALVNLGVVTIVFVLVERYADLSDEQTDETDEWDPLSLPPLNNPNRVKRGEMIGGIVGAIIFLVILNTFGSYSINEQTGLATLVTPEFLAIIPLFSLSLGLDIILKTIVAWQGRWQTWSRWADIGQESFGVFVLYLIVQQPILTLGDFPNLMTRLILGFIIVIVILEIIGKLYRLLVGRPIVDLDMLKGRLASG